MKMQGNRLVRRVLAIAAALFFSASASAAPEILVLSNRADLITGGDALVEIKWPAGTNTNDAQVDAGYKATIDKFGTTDVLVNNAALLNLGGNRGQATTLETLDAIWRSTE